MPIKYNQGQLHKIVTLYYKQTFAGDLIPGVLHFFFFTKCVFSISGFCFFLQVSFPLSLFFSPSFRVCFLYKLGYFDQFFAPLSASIFPKQSVFSPPNVYIPPSEFLSLPYQSLSHGTHPHEVKQMFY